MTSRILYAAFDLVPSPKGASTHITYFVRGLVEAGYDVTLITAGDRALPGEQTYYGARLLRAPAGDDPHFLRRALAFGEFVVGHAAESQPYDLVHVRSVWSGWQLVQEWSRLDFGKLLYEVNGLPSVELKYHYPAVAQSATVDKIREWEIATLRAADAIICPARVTADYLASLGAAREQIEVIPNGVDTDLFRPQAAVVSPQDGVPTVLYVGTFADWQGLDVLVRAMPLVLAHRPVRVLLAGRGRKRQRKALLKMARKLDVGEALEIMPAVPHAQVPQLISQAVLGVAPLGYNDRNVNQGCCPIKVLEYMACGRPVVAADLPVVRELVCPGGGAFLFPPDDPAELAGQILRALDCPEQSAALGRQGAEWVARHFTWQLAQERLIEVYRALEV